MAVRTSFIEGGAGKILVAVHEAARSSETAIIVLPALADEMNKSRRLVWETGQLVAKAGHTVFVPDLFGTGDSEGNFEDATWAVWVEDLRRTVIWAQERGSNQFSALAVRFGATLLLENILGEDVSFHRVVTWNPVCTGADLLRQMLRMKSMAIRMTGARAESLQSMYEALLYRESSQNLGGYIFKAGLARDIEGAVFSKHTCVPTAGGLNIELTSIPTDQNLDEPEDEGAAGAGWHDIKMAGGKFWLLVEPMPNPLLAKTTAEFLAR